MLYLLKFSAPIIPLSNGYSPPHDMQKEQISNLHANLGLEEYVVKSKFLQ